MKQLWIVFLTGFVSISLQAQKAKSNPQLDGLSNSIRSVVKSDLPEAEQNERVKSIVQDFMETNPVAMHNVNTRKAEKKLAELKKVTPMAEADVKEFVRLQKEAYNAIGGAKPVKNKPAKKSRSLGNAALITSVGTAIDYYGTYLLSGGLGDNSMLSSGYVYLSPEGVDAYNYFMESTILQDPTCSNCTVLIPTDFYFSFAPVSSVTIAIF